MRVETVVRQRGGRGQTRRRRRAEKRILPLAVVLVGPRRRVRMRIPMRVWSVDDARTTMPVATMAITITVIARTTTTTKCTTRKRRV